VRKKLADIRHELPPEVLGPFFNDELGDVYGSIYAFSAEDEHLARNWSHQREHGLDERRLAGSVRPHDRHQHAGGNRKVDVPQHRLVAVGDRQVVDLNSRLLRNRRRGEGVRG
jgi:hypothetical protein